MGIPRYLAMARVEDLERTMRQADELALSARPDGSDSVALIQCGRESEVAAQLASLLKKAGRHVASVVVKQRAQARSESLLHRLDGTSSLWVFADDLFETFMAVFATDLAFALRARARQGTPVVGIGGGALALGGLLLANRVCRHAAYDLVGGLGWAPRVLMDSSAGGTASEDDALARTAVRSLPGLLGVQLGESGGLRVEGGRVESIGAGPVVLFGGNENGKLVIMSLEPGQVANIAPPPFAPFDRGLLPATVRAVVRPEPLPKPALRQAPLPTPAPVRLTAAAAAPHTGHGTGRVCPMCNKVHHDSKVELAA